MQNWRTKSGKKSSITGERYLPEKAIKALSNFEYRLTTKSKRKATKKGKQFSKQPKYIANKIRQFRNEFKMDNKIKVFDEIINFNLLDYEENKTIQ